MAELAFLATSRIKVDIFEGILLPKDIVFNKPFLGHGSDHSRILVDRVAQHMLLNHVQHVVVEQPLTADVPGHHHFQTADHLRVAHVLDVHRQQTHDALEESVVCLFKEHWLTLLVKHLFVEHVQELSHVSGLKLVQHAQDVGSVVLPHLLVSALQAVHD